MKALTFLTFLTITAASADESRTAKKPSTAESSVQATRSTKGAKRDPDTQAALSMLNSYTGPVVDKFNEALHTEEVKRDLNAAADQYAGIVEDVQSRKGGWGEGVAAVSLFRIAEIRRKQGNEGEARRYYETVIKDYADWEPVAKFSRQQLGLDPSDFMPELTKLEKNHRLTENVERDLWRIRTRRCDDKFVLVTFEVKPEEGVAGGEIPEASEVKTLHYCPNGPLTGLVSSTSVAGEVIKEGKFFGNPIRGTLVTRLTGFGHSIDIPRGLRQFSAVTMTDSGWTGQRSSSFDALVAWQFVDEMDEDINKLKVKLTVANITEAEARELAENRAVSLPKLEGKEWSFTLPPSPTEFEKVHDEK